MAMLTIWQLVKRLQKHMVLDETYMKSVKIEADVNTKAVYLTVVYLIPAEFAEDDK